MSQSHAVCGLTTPSHSLQLHPDNEPVRLHEASAPAIEPYSSIRGQSVLEPTPSYASSEPAEWPTDRRVFRLISLIAHRWINFDGETWTLTGVPATLAAR
jgi:hypothetical protein